MKTALKFSQEYRSGLLTERERRLKKCQDTDQLSSPRR